jgi:uncharacterized glyoxalase superfamily protein PhnB
MFRVEHVAWQVKDPVKVAEWYCRVLGFRVLRKLDGAPKAHFLADASGKLIIEIYNNPIAPQNDYAKMHSLQLHLAFSVDDPAAAREMLLKEGCTIDDELTTLPSGDQVLMLKDPFGFAIQVVKRKTPML